MESLEENFLDQFEMTKRIDEQMEVKNLEYSFSGDVLSYTAGESLKIYSAATGGLKNIISVRIDAMKYFQNNTILHSKDSVIYYLSVYDNKYLRKFETRSDKILSLSVNPFDDVFMSIGNRTIDLWDVRHKSPTSAIDSQGRMGAISTGYEYALADNNFIYIFDRRSDAYPLEAKSIRSRFYTNMWYTGDDSCIVLSSNWGYTFLDSSGDFVASCTSENSSVGDTIDESNILLYSSSRFIFAYKIFDKKRIGRVETDKECKAVKTSPTRPQFVSSTSDGLKIWNIATEQVL